MGQISGRVNFLVNSLLCDDIEEESVYLGKRNVAKYTYNNLSNYSIMLQDLQVLVSGGIKSRLPFTHARRLKHISSVQVMNQVLFGFARSFMKVPTRTFDLAWKGKLPSFAWRNSSC